MQIVNLNFSRPLLKRDPKEVRYIVVHHTGGPLNQSFLEIHEYHRRLGWGGIGYHYMVYHDGNVYKVRPTLSVPACVRGKNRQVICVALVGNFQNLPPSSKHLFYGASFVGSLLYQWHKAYGSVLEVVRHSDLSDTDCPGKRFPWDRFLGLVEGDLA